MFYSQCNENDEKHILLQFVNKNTPELLKKLNKAEILKNSEFALFSSGKLNIKCSA